MNSKAWHGRLSKAFRRWDRSTAYYRKDQYEHAYQEACKRVWDDEVTEFMQWLESKRRDSSIG